MTNDSEVWFFLDFGGLAFGLGFIFIIGQIYLCFFKLERILRSLSNSFGVVILHPFLRSGFFRAGFMMNQIASYLLYPNRSIRSGALDELDYLNFPRGLLYLILGLYMTAVGSMVSMLVHYFYKNGWLG